MKKTFVMGLALLTSTAFAQSYDSSNSQMNNSDPSFNSGTSDYSGMESQNMDEASGVATPGDQTMQLAEAGSRHMFEFNIDSAVAAAVSFDKTKASEQKADNDVNWNLNGNYFYGVHRMIQAGFRFSYFNGVAAQDLETVELELGGYLNSDEDFSRSVFLGAFVGGGWSQTFGTNDAGRDDLRTASVSIGKRFPLDRWGIKHVTWSPELALKYVNSTTDQLIDYNQSLQFRILQFSVLF